MGVPQPEPLYTAENYLALERRADERHQFVDGRIYAMAGETLEHSTISFNLAAILVTQLRGKNCRGLSPNMKILSGPLRKDQRSGLFSYPDASVVCGEPRFHDEHRDVLLNPTVLFEVLSPSSEAFDRGEKFRRYRTHLDTLGDYVLISSDKPFVEHFQRQAGGQWLYSSLEGLEGNLELVSIDCRLPLAELYERVGFAADITAASDPSGR
ncbi:MAG: Uma2 family endonuclease [Methylococcales bacterium]